MDGDEKARQVVEDRERFLLDVAHRYAMTDAALDGYGEWIAALAPWSHFVTLTHRLPDQWSPAYTRDGRSTMVDTGQRIVGARQHRRAVRDWFYEDVRRLAGRVRWWSETELHESGQAHEHGLLAAPSNAPMLSVRQAWWDRAGYATIEPVEALTEAAKYVAKYTGKAAAAEPLVFGLGRWEPMPGSWANRQGLDAAGVIRLSKR